jgi:HTH-type transcriptional regulator / antitoxin HigA
VRTTDQGTGVDMRCITAYGELLRVLEPRVVVEQVQADQYLKAINSLTDLHEMSAGQLDAVRLLGRLVAQWEEEREEPITATPQEKVRHLLEENGLSQAALVPDVFPNRQNVSAFLAGRRRLTYDRAVKLGAFFHLPPAAFYPAPHVR